MDDRFDDAQVRRRIEDLEKALERAGSASVDNGAAALLVKTVTKVTYPTAAGRWIYCRVQTIGGDPVEGGVVTYADTDKFLYAAHVGARVPPNGTRLLALYCGGAWSIRHD